MPKIKKTVHQGLLRRLVARIAEDTMLSITALLTAGLLISGAAYAASYIEWEPENILGFWSRDIATNTFYHPDGVAIGTDFVSTGIQGSAAVIGSLGRPSVLAKDYSSENNETITKSFTLTEPGVLFLTGSGKASYTGSLSNAGVRTTLTVNGGTCASDYSFEGGSTSMVFDSSAFCVKELPIGSYNVAVSNVASAATLENASLQYVVLGTSAINPSTPESQSSVLAREYDTELKNITNKTFTLTEPGIIFLTGYGKASYNGGTTNAGVRTTIKIDGEECAADYSFEGSSSSVVFDSSATCIKELSAGLHNIEMINDPSVATLQSSYLQYVVLGTAAEGASRSTSKSILLASDDTTELNAKINKTFTLTEPGVLFFTGYGNAAYTGSLSNAGVRTTLKINGTVCASDYSFEGGSTSMVFDSSATCIKEVSAGSYEIEVSNVASAATLQKSYLQYVVLGTSVTGGATSPISADLKLDVEGKIGATHYCDEDGNNCNPITSLIGGGSGGSGGSPGGGFGGDFVGGLLETEVSNYSSAGGTAQTFTCTKDYHKLVYCKSHTSNGDLECDTSISADGRTCTYGSTCVGRAVTTRAICAGIAPAPLQAKVVAAKSFDKDTPESEGGDFEVETVDSSIPSYRRWREEYITLEKPAVVITTGGGTYQYSRGFGENAGLRTSISIDGQLCAQDYSFEGLSYSVTFSTSATCIKYLEAGSHAILIQNHIQRLTSNHNSTYPSNNSHMQYVVIGIDEEGSSGNGASGNTIVMGGGAAAHIASDTRVSANSTPTIANKTNVYVGSSANAPYREIDLNDHGFDCGPTDEDIHFMVSQDDIGGSGGIDAGVCNYHQHSINKCKFLVTCGGSPLTSGNLVGSSFNWLAIQSMPATEGGDNVTPEEITTLQEQIDALESRIEELLEADGADGSPSAAASLMANILAYDYLDQDDDDFVDQDPFNLRQTIQKYIRIDEAGIITLTGYGEYDTTDAEEDASAKITIYVDRIPCTQAESFYNYSDPITVSAVCTKYLSPGFHLLGAESNGYGLEESFGVGSSGENGNISIDYYVIAAPYVGPLATELDVGTNEYECRTNCGSWASSANRANCSSPRPDNPIPSANICTYIDALHGCEQYCEDIYR